MQVVIDSKEGINCQVSVTIPAVDAKNSYNRHLREIGKKARVDGFRKGHIPQTFLEQNFGYRAFQDALNEFVWEALGTVSKEHKIDPVSTPNVEYNGDGSLDKDVQFVLKFEIMPAIELKPFADLKLKELKCEIKDSDVDSMIDVLRKQQSKWQAKDDLAIGKGTMTKIDFTGKIDGVEFPGGSAKDYALNVDNSQMIPGFTEQLMGHKAGEKFTIDVKFPDDYHAEELKGKPAQFDIVVNSVSEEILPEVDADFIKLFGINDGDIEKFKSELRTNMEREKVRALRVRQQNEITDALLKQYGEFDIPQASFDKEYKAVEENRKQQLVNMFGPQAKNFPIDGEVKEKLEKVARDHVRVTAILTSIIEQDKVEAPTKEEIDAELSLAAQPYEKPEEVKEMLRKDPKQLNAIVNAAFEIKLLNHILAKAKDGEQELTFQELVGRN